MNKKNTLGQKLLRFLDGKGFYLVVLLCVSAVGVSGWYLSRTMSDTTADPSDEVAVSSPLDNTANEISEPVSGNVGLVDLPNEEVETAATPSPVPVTEPETPVPVSEPDEESNAAVPLVYTWPVKGIVVNEYSLETLLYDETMGDWRVHTGLDIAASQGTSVLSTAAGTVMAIFDDDLMGTTVVIDHGQGMVSTYSNLQTVPTVEIGDAVYTGTIIGAVGSTALAESATASHLHFELTCDGASVDPLDYLPEQ